MQFIIWGTTRTGVRQDPLIGFTSSIDEAIRQYRESFPFVVHVNVDVALPDEGRIEDGH